jgi:hypothetical protein
MAQFSTGNSQTIAEINPMMGNFELPALRGPLKSCLVGFGDVAPSKHRSNTFTSDNSGRDDYFTCDMPRSRLNLLLTLYTNQVRNTL